jgi:hypothetical protein
MCGLRRLGEGSLLDVPDSAGISQLGRLDLSADTDRSDWRSDHVPALPLLKTLVPTSLRAKIPSGLISTVRTVRLHNEQPAPDSQASGFASLTAPIFDSGPQIRFSVFPHRWWCISGLPVVFIDLQIGQSNVLSIPSPAKKAGKSYFSGCQSFSTGETNPFHPLVPSVLIFRRITSPFPEGRSGAEIPVWSLLAAYMSMSMVITVSQSLWLRGHWSTKAIQIRNEVKWRRSP